MNKLLTDIKYTYLLILLYIVYIDEKNKVRAVYERKADFGKVKQ